MWTGCNVQVVFCIDFETLISLIGFVSVSYSSDFCCDTDRDPSYYVLISMADLVNVYSFDMCTEGTRSLFSCSRESGTETSCSRRA